jgi:hypothetical protein
MSEWAKPVQIATGVDASEDFPDARSHTLYVLLDDGTILCSWWDREAMKQQWDEVPVWPEPRVLA